MSRAIGETRVEHYRYSVQWSPDDESYVATVAEFPSLTWLDPNRTHAIGGLEKLIGSVIDDLAASGELVPQPIADRWYSGRLNLRVSEQLHRRLATAALAHVESLNAYATQILERQLSA